jgi:hypothetical protein
VTASTSIEPELPGSRLVELVYAQNQPEAELLQARLSEVGVPSVLQRAAGFDVPDFLAAGPRVVLVQESEVRTARDVLQLHTPPPPPVTPHVSESAVAKRVFLGLLAGVAVLTLVVWVAALAF